MDVFLYKHVTSAQFDFGTRVKSRLAGPYSPQTHLDVFNNTLTTHYIMTGMLTLQNIILLPNKLR